MQFLSLDPLSHACSRGECNVCGIVRMTCTCTNVSCEWVSCLHSPSIFWNSFQETEITTLYQMIWAAMSSNSFATVNFATAKLKMETLPAGFPLALCSTAIQFCDRHSNRSFLLLRISDLVFDVVDVLDVSVSEIVAFPPSELLAFEGIVYFWHKYFILIWSFFCIKCSRAF